MSKKNKPMIRVEKILRSATYREYTNRIDQWEKDRRFCRHDRNHLWETARTAYILYLSKEVECEELAGYSPFEIKEMIYAASFLHDIGRFKEYENEVLDHAEESAVLARPLLVEAGFCTEEIQWMTKAIAHHRVLGDDGFDRLLYRADKESRPCYSCPVLAECKKFSPDKPPVITV